MERANPTDMRKAMNMARALSEAGILFVPMPVADSTEFETLAAAAWARLDDMAVAADGDMPRNATDRDVKGGGA